jgi:hypothetical protein
MMAIIIRNENGKWLVNDKPYDQLSPSEKDFFNEFLISEKNNFFNFKLQENERKAL